VTELARANQNAMSYNSGEHIGAPEMTYKAGGDIRFVVATGCQNGCNFCHLEGHKDRDELGTLNDALAGWKTAGKNIPLIERLGGAVLDDDVKNTIRIAQLLGLNKVHLTGGEPTLHPNVLKIIDQFSKSGIQVGMTTHGEISQSLMDQFLTSGLNGINFSIHAIEPSQYLTMDLIAQEIASKYGEDAGLRFAQGRLKQKMRNITSAVTYSREQDRRFKVKANSVVQDADTAEKIVRFCNNEGIDVRLQSNLNNKVASGAMIAEVIVRLDAIPVREDIAIGDSSGSGTVYAYSGGEFKVKSFGEIYLSSMCDPCDLRDTSDCRERFYGVRVEKGLVTTCIDKQEKGTTSFSFDEFINLLERNKGVPAEIRTQYEAMSRMTEK